MISLFNHLDYVNRMAKLDMLVIDDFGLMELDLDKCRDFFEVIDSRDNNHSTVVVSQLPVKFWYDLFADNRSYHSQGVPP